MSQFDSNLVGIGLYTPAEAARLVNVPAPKIARWLRGHNVKAAHYDALWTPQVNLGDGHIYLGFRDLMEVRVADAFLKHGLSAVKIRRAIEVARDLIGDDHPLSTDRFRTDGRTIFLDISREDGDSRLIDILKSQYAFRDVIAPSLRNIEFEEGIPSRWWPLGKAARIVVDPRRSFGRPIEADSGVPAAVLAGAATAEGSPEAAARLWAVTPAAVRRAIAFQRSFDRPKAA